MAQRKNKLRMSFQVKVLLPVIAVMTVLMLTTMWLVNERISTQLQSEAAQQLEMDNNIFKMTQEMRLTNMLLRYRPVMNDVRYTGFIQTTENQGALVETMNQFLRSQIEASGATVMACLLDDGLPGMYARA